MSFLDSQHKYRSDTGPVDAETFLRHHTRHPNNYTLKNYNLFKNIVTYMQIMIVRMTCNQKLITYIFMFSERKTLDVFITYWLNFHFILIRVYLIMV